MQIATVVGILLIVVGLARFAFGGITHYWRVRACAGSAPSGFEAGYRRTRSGPVLPETPLLNSSNLTAGFPAPVVPWTSRQVWQLHPFAHISPRRDRGTEKVF